MGTRSNTIGLLTILIAHALTTTPLTDGAQQSQSPLKHPEPVVLNVTVTNKAGEFVAGLRPDNFQISIDKKRASIVSMSNADLPVSVGILLDSSGSTIAGSETAAAKNLVVLRQALRHFIELSNPSNDYFLVGFNTKPQLLVDWTSDPSALDRFDRLQVYGRTALYDACYVAVDKLRSGRHSKRALVLISDGQDNHSLYTLNQVRELLKETDVLLYSITFPSDVDYESSLGTEGRSILAEFSSLSGGRVFFKRDGHPLRLKDANLALETIATELRSQYAISIMPNDSSAEKKWRKIKMKVALEPGPRQMKDLAARTRQGFYAR